MRKVGRRQIETVVRMLPATAELMRDDDGREFVEAATVIEPRTVIGRWLLWRPVEEPTIAVGSDLRDWVMNTLTVRRKQRWEVRYIGRRRLNRA
jgi:hypothetical protein